MLHELPPNGQPDLKLVIRDKVPLSLEKRPPAEAISGRRRSANLTTRADPSKLQALHGKTRLLGQAARRLNVGPDGGEGNIRPIFNAEIGRNGDLFQDCGSTPIRLSTAIIPFPRPCLGVTVAVVAL